jgi:Amt family ammonium transporter
VAAFVFLMSLVAWAILKVVMGLRVSREEELKGLDIGEHGNEAYAGFQVFSNT